MAFLPEIGIRNFDDLACFEAKMTLDERLPERSILDVFVAAAARWPNCTALTMLMTGEHDEPARRVSYRELLRLVRGAANLFARLGGQRPGVAYMLPSMVETHATLWGAETAGYAVPINFLLQPEHIAGMLKASGARILVALGPHPVLDIWQKALALRDQDPGLKLLRVAAPGTPAMAGVLDFHAALMAEADDRLMFGEPGRDDAVAAYFHTGGAALHRRQRIDEAPPVRPSWSRTRIAVNSWLRSAARFWATCAPATHSRPHCRFSTWAGPSPAA